MQRWWWVIAPAAVGLALAAFMNFTAAPPKPYLPPRTNCVTNVPEGSVPACELAIKQLARVSMRRRLLKRGEIDHVDADGEAQARSILVARAERRRQRHQDAIDWWQARSDDVLTQRMWSLVPLSGGLTLTGLMWLIARRREEEKPHTVTLSAHHVQIDDLRLPIANLEDIRLEPEQKRWRELVVVPASGEPRRLKLDALSAETQTLESMLRGLPDAEARADERRRIEAIALERASLKPAP